eukprot:2327748-Rhodomonas_salina.1
MCRRSTSILIRICRRRDIRFEKFVWGGGGPYNHDDRFIAPSITISIIELQQKTKRKLGTGITTSTTGTSSIAADVGGKKFNWYPGIINYNGPEVGNRTTDVHENLCAHLRLTGVCPGTHVCPGSRMLVFILWRDLYAFAMPTQTDFTWYLRCDVVEHACHRCPVHPLRLFPLRRNCFESGRHLLYAHTTERQQLSAFLTFVLDVASHVVQKRSRETVTIQLLFL